MNTTPSLFPIEEAPAITNHVRLEFDGGTPCNVPSRGYGIGYGSYRFDDLEPVRVDHGIPCSNNAAEILTLCVALESLAKLHPDAQKFHVSVFGDSQIALKWLRVATGDPTAGLKRKKACVPNGSPLFIESIERLKRAVTPFGKVTGTWQPREKSVSTFGH